jgi:hypothetical protein
MSGNRRRFRTSLLPVLTAVSLAGCDNDSAAPNPAAGADAALAARKPLATLEWNQLALNMIKKHKPSQQAAQRGMAYLGLAQFGAADAVQGQGSKPTATLGAIAGASAVVLAYLHPVDADAFDAEVRAREAALGPSGQAGFRAGETLGRAVGEQAVALARSDRFDAPWTGTTPSGPGVWYSSTVPATAPALPMLGQVQPFLMTSGSQFRSAPPPAFGSPAFQEALGEVRRIADTRTQRQDSIARFWVMGTGTLIAG